MIIVTTTDYETYKMTTGRTCQQILTHNDFEDYLYDVLSMSGFMVNRTMFWLSETNACEIKYCKYENTYKPNGR